MQAIQWQKGSITNASRGTANAWHTYYALADGVTRLSGK
ncbi:DUF3265 domain-containing protein [Vibrio anguillarum]|nr:DUF3265 domain-containing protein [Vibrio anguillarum]AXM53750.1 DUF3265 domain-containing protein [Vibrio anguillarum]